MNTISYQNYYKGCLKYSYFEEENSFKTNLCSDFHVFIIWEGGLSKVEPVVAKLSKKFEILFRADIQWSKEKIPENIGRLYKINDKNLISAHCKNKARKGFFHCIVVEDKNPKYNYRQNVSGPIRIVNINNLEIKREIRTEMEGNFIHSSSCPEEFYEQIFLLFESSKIDEILSKKLNDRVYSFKNDLIGSNGWESLTEYFQVINKCSDYLIQRSYLTLVEKIEDGSYGEGYKDKDKDIDIICADKNELLIASNCFMKKFDGIDVYCIKVKNRNVRVDVENSLYDKLWVKNILQEKVLYKDGFFVPRSYDYFFIVFYYESLIKRKFKEHHKIMLLDIAQKLNFDFISKDYFSDDEKKAKLVSGYLSANGYKVMRPTIKERGAHYSLNSNVLKFISPNLLNFKAVSVLQAYRIIVPEKLRSLIPEPFKKLIKKLL